MKKFFVVLLAALLLLAIFTYTAMATDNGEDDRIEAIDAAVASNEQNEEPVVVTTYVTDPKPSEEPALPETFTWSYLLTTGGAALFVYFIVRFAKAPLDKVWKIPTRLLVYFLCLITLAVANAFFNHGITVETAALCVVNALISAYTAYGLYEVWDKTHNAKA